MLTRWDRPHLGSGLPTSLFAVCLAREAHVVDAAGRRQKTIVCPTDTGKASS